MARCGRAGLRGNGEMGIGRDWRQRDLAIRKFYPWPLADVDTDTVL